MFRLPGGACSARMAARVGSPVCRVAVVMGLGPMARASAAVAMVAVRAATMVRMVVVLRMVGYASSMARMIASRATTRFGLIE